MLTNRAGRMSREGKYEGRRFLRREIMSSTFNWLAKLAGVSLLVLTLVYAGFAIGRGTSTDVLAKPAFAGLPGFDNAARGKSLSMATGFVENGVEALFALDHLTGDLFGWVLDSRTGNVASTFRISAGRTLNVSGEPDYVLSTGLMDFVGAAEGNLRPAQSVVFVGDGNTGKVVGFVLMYNRTAIQRGDDRSAGEFRLISEMVTRDARAIRDQGN